MISSVNNINDDNNNQNSTSSISSNSSGDNNKEGNINNVNDCIIQNHNSSEIIELFSVMRYRIIRRYKSIENLVQALRDYDENNNSGTLQHNNTEIDMGNVEDEPKKINEGKKENREAVEGYLRMALQNNEEVQYRDRFFWYWQAFYEKILLDTEKEQVMKQIKNMNTESSSTCSTTTWKLSPKVEETRLTNKYIESIIRKNTPVQRICPNTDNVLLRFQNFQDATNHIMNERKEKIEEMAIKECIEFELAAFLMGGRNICYGYKYQLLENVNSNRTQNNI